MNRKKEASVVVKLMLNAKEAKYLHAYLQNSSYNIDETQEQMELRIRLFLAIGLGIKPDMESMEIDNDLPF